MGQLIQVREDKNKFDLLINDNIPEVFSDGLSQLLMGYPVSKLIFHSVTAPALDNGIEQRQGVIRLAIPTPVLLELCRNILSSALSSIDELSEGGKQIDTQVKKILDGVSIVPSSTSESVKGKSKK